MASQGLLGAILSAAVILAAITGCGFAPRAESGDSEPPLVSIAQPQVLEATKDRVLRGRAAASMTVPLHASITGRLLSVAEFTENEQQDFREGAFVSKGDLLFAIEQESYVARLDGAKAAKQRAELLRSRAQQEYATAQKRSGSNEGGEADPAAVGELQAASIAYEEASAAVQLAEAEVEGARIALEQTEIRAPISGRVGERLVSTGSVVGIGGATELTEIVAIDPIHVFFDLSLPDFLQLQRYQDDPEVYGDRLTVEVVAECEGDLRYEGTIDLVAPTIDAVSQQGQVRVSVPNPEERLVPGMNVRVRLQSYEREPVLLVESRSVRMDLGGTYLFVVAGNNRVQRRYVRLGKQIEDMRVVLDRFDVERCTGIDSGESYVVAGLPGGRLPGELMCVRITPSSDGAEDAPSERAAHLSKF